MNENIDLEKHMRDQTWKFVKEEKQPNYHLIALEVAATLPNQSLNELLINAEKIEHWLLQPERIRIKNSVELRKLIEEAFI